MLYALETNVVWFPPICWLPPFLKQRQKLSCCWQNSSHSRMSSGWPLKCYYHSLRPSSLVIWKIHFLGWLWLKKGPASVFNVVHLMLLSISASKLFRIDLRLYMIQRNLFGNALTYFIVYSRKGQWLFQWAFKYSVGKNMSYWAYYPWKFKFKRTEFVFVQFLFSPSTYISLLWFFLILKRSANMHWQWNVKNDIQFWK